MDYVFNPISNKLPSGASKAGDEVSYALKISRFCRCDEVYIMLQDDSDNKKFKIKMPLHTNDEKFYEFRARITYDKPGLYWYHFLVKNGGNLIYLCKTQQFDIEPQSSVTSSFAQTVYEKDTIVDASYQRGVIYHIFIDRFRKSGNIECKDGMILRKDWGGQIDKYSDDFLVLNLECFGGNLRGITEKLAYIKSLGVTTIYLSPIFESYSYHKYDTANYEKIDSMFGGEEAFAQLIKTAKQQGMSVLLDGVFNHVGSDSIYFNKLNRFNTVGAFQSKKSKYYDWFKFEKYPHKYTSWWDIDTIPQFNANSQTLQDYFCGPKGVIAKHMKSGILGFRLDVVDEITDNYLNPLCQAIKRGKSDALVLGEVWEDAATKIAYSKRRHYFSGNQLDSVMNYPLKNSIIDFVLYGNSDGLASTMFMLKDHYPKFALNTLMNFLGTHDTKRILSIFTDFLANNHRKADAFDMLKLASALQYCSPGVPAVFYGDEVGIQGGEAPFCRVCFPWGTEDKNILEWYKKLGKLRSLDVFIDGEVNVLLAHNGVFVLERKNETTRIVVAANCSWEDFKLNLSAHMKDFLTSKPIKDSVVLKSYEFVILTQILK